MPSLVLQHIYCMGQAFTYKKIIMNTLLVQKVVGSLQNPPFGQTESPLHLIYTFSPCISKNILIIAFHVSLCLFVSSVPDQTSYEILAISMCFISRYSLKLTNPNIKRRLHKYTWTPYYSSITFSSVGSFAFRSDNRRNIWINGGINLMCIGPCIIVIVEE